MSLCDLNEMLTLIQPTGEELPPQSDYNSYKKFFLEIFPSIRRDVFSGELMVKEGELWEPVRSHISILRSYADDTNSAIKPSRIADHLARFQREVPTELLVDLPDFDPSTDPLREICNCIHPFNVTREELYELILGWGANMWRRFENPTQQNQVFILQSSQGIGKDYLLRSIFGGLQQFFINFTVNTTERDNLAQLTQGLVLNISEFDRTAKLNTGLLKDMITRDSTFVRLPYDRSAVKRAVRCSFVGSCNTKNVLLDTTGNRRFIVIEVEKIDFNYPSNKSLEILAQFRAEARKGFDVSTTTQAKMTAYISSITPVEPKDHALARYDQRIAELESEHPSAYGLFSREQIKEVVEDVSSESCLSEKRLLALLQSTGRSHRTSAGMIYGRPSLKDRYRDFGKLKQFTNS